MDFHKIVGVINVPSDYNFCSTSKKSLILIMKIYIVIMLYSISKISKYVNR